MSSDNRIFCDLPPELLLHVVNHLSFKDHARWVLADRRHRACLSPLLYLRLLPSTTDNQEPPQQGDAHQSRKDVVQWAIRCGRVHTLERIDEVEDISLFFDITFTSTAAKEADLGLKLIHLAALSGYTPVVVDYLLQRGADVNVRTQGGLLPLHLAQTGEVVRLLAGHTGTSLDHNAISSALISSISHLCEASAVTAFLAIGADPKYIDHDGKSPIEAAITHANVDALVVLLDVGIDANQVLPDGGSLLYNAIWLGARDYSVERATDMATALLDRGASPNSGSDTKPAPQYRSEACHTTALFLAVMMKVTSSVELVELLLERGADLNAPYTRYRELFWPGRSLQGFDQAFSKSLVGNTVAAMIDAGARPPDPGAAQKLKLLIRHGGNIDQKLGDNTLLQHALVQDGTRAQWALDVFQPLFELGADVTCVDSRGNTTLHLFCGSYIQHVQRYQGYNQSWCYTKLKIKPPLASLIDDLIDRGADPNARNHEGRTALMLLCRNKHIVPTAMFIRILLRHPNIDVKALDEQGSNVLHYATGDPADPFHNEPCFCLQMLLNRANFDAEDVNLYNDAGRAPLHLLLEARYMPPTRRRDEEYDDTRPHQRIVNKTRAVVMLIRAGADVRARTCPFSWKSDGGAGGETPLHMALQGSDEHEIQNVTEVLLRHGASADVNEVSPSLGLTPLMMVAVAAGRGELSRNTTQHMITLLLAAGAETQMRNAQGRTAWDIFVELKGLTPSSISPWPLCFEGVAPMDLF